jgi:hypothetical protein
LRDGRGEAMNAIHADLQSIVAYWLGELDEAREAAI